MLLLYATFMYAGAFALAAGIRVESQKQLWVWFSLIAGISVWLSFSSAILQLICNVDLLFIWFGIQIHKNEKKTKTSNPKYWWLPGVLSIVMVYGYNYCEIVNRYSITEEYIKEITIALMKVALFFVLGYWMAYPYKKNK